MKKNPLFFIIHIEDSINDIDSFLKGVTKAEFLRHKEKQNAVIRSLEVIGEAVKNIPIEFTVKYPYIELSKIAGMRDKLIHHYFGIDLETVWKVVKDYLPTLK